MSIKLAVLISGSGTNLQAIIDAIEAGKLDASIEIVIASNERAKGLQRAAAAHIPTMALSKDLFLDPDVADEVLAQLLMQYEVDYVVLAGYMRKIGPLVLQSFPLRVVNLHPALLPSFAGAHAIIDAWTYGVKVTGVTVHFANADYDKGPIIAQRAVTIDEGMTLDALEERIHEAEHQLYPEVLQWLAQGRVHLCGDATVRIDPA